MTHLGWILAGARRGLLPGVLWAWAAVAAAADPSPISAAAKVQLARIGISRGICAVLGLPEGQSADFVLDLARGTDVQVYFQSSQADDVQAVRKAAKAAGLLGTRIFADRGDGRRVHLATRNKTSSTAAAAA
jgi:hypothetical protein